MKSYSSIWIHLIWTTKDRNPLLHKKIRVQLFQFIKRQANQKGFIVDCINGIEDHVHCLLRLLPAQQVSEAVKHIKGSSSRWINQEAHLDVEFSWQVGYGAISVSPSQIDNIRQYIINQEKHHRHWKLDEEIKKFKFYKDRF